MLRKLFLITIICLVIFSSIFSVSFSFTQEFPQRPIECVVPYSPGGQTDTLGRAIAEYFEIGQPMVVINMPGAGASLGAMEVYNAEPDGYKLLLIAKEAQLLYYLSGMIPAPTWKEMIPLGILTFDTDMVTVSKDSPLNSWQDLLDYANENPGELTWGSAGTGSSNHVFSEIIFNEFDVDITYTPYQGNADARVAALGGHLDVLFGTISEARSLIESGDLKPLLIISNQKSKFLPEVPIISDYGVDLNLGISTGLWAPPNTPEEVINKLSVELKRLVDKKEFVDLVENKLNYEIVWIDSEEIKETMENEYPLYQEMVKRVLAE